METHSGKNTLFFDQGSVNAFLGSVCVRLGIMKGPYSHLPRSRACETAWNTHDFDLHFSSVIQSFTRGKQINIVGPDAFRVSSRKSSTRSIAEDNEPLCDHASHHV